MQALKRQFRKNPLVIKNEIHQYFINKILNFYEGWVIPKNSISLRELKLQEFEDRKKLIHPYTRDAFIADNLDSERVLNLQKKVRMSNMHNFNLTYDRHDGKYGFKTSNFKDHYIYSDPWVEYLKDPDWYYKFQPKRFSFKVLFFWLTVFSIGMYYRVQSVK